MKTSKTVFTLLLLSAISVLPHKTTAQVLPDTVYNTENGSDTWHFSIEHPAGKQYSISNVILWIDRNEYPNVKLAGNIIDPPLTPEAWYTYHSNDTAIWCANQGYNFIALGAKDSFFDFTLEPVNPGDSIYYYPIKINWTTNWGTGSDCSKLFNLSKGSFYIYDVPWQGYRGDTVTAIVSASGCDPVFDFTVVNSSTQGVGAAITRLVFQSTDPTAGIIRLSDIQMPPNWQLDSATEVAVYCHDTTGVGIAVDDIRSGFNIGLSANPNVSSFSFAWQAFGYLGLAGADTVWNIPVSIPTCSENSSSDTLTITNTSRCSFDFDFENFHTTSAKTITADTVSGLTKYVISSPTPGVTFTSITKPPVSIYPQVADWFASKYDTNTLTFSTAQQKNAQPGGLSWPWGVTINNPNDSPITIEWKSLNYGNIISSGTETINCTNPPTPDTAWLVGVQIGCEYEMVVKNIHKNPTSSIHEVGVENQTTKGTFYAFPGTYSGPAGWQANFVNGIQFINDSGSDLVTNNLDTFYFTPSNPGATWRLNYLTYHSEQELTSETLNAPSCTPIIVCDTVTEAIDATDCTDTLIINNRTTSNVDRIVVTPLGAGWHIGSVTNSPLLWSAILNSDSVVFSGSTVSPESNGYFEVSFINSTSTGSFPVLIRTYSGGLTGSECTTIDTMTCGADAVNMPSNGQSKELSLTVSPNPLANRSDIGVTLGEFSEVNLILTDVLGRTQETLFSGSLPAGDHTLPLDGSTLAPGTYYIRIEAEGQRLTKKIVVQR